jgi:hypothetical protein
LGSQICHLSHIHSECLIAVCFQSIDFHDELTKVIAGKKPIKKLPETIEITAATTVEDAKKQIAKAARISDFNRVAILDVDKQAIFKDRNALLAQQQAVADSYQIMVKDLGTWSLRYVCDTVLSLYV